MSAPANPSSRPVVYANISGFRHERALSRPPVFDFIASDERFMAGTGPRRRAAACAPGRRSPIPRRAGSMALSFSARLVKRGRPAPERIVDRLNTGSSGLLSFLSPPMHTMPATTPGRPATTHAIVAPYGIFSRTSDGEVLCSCEPLRQSYQRLSMRSQCRPSPKWTRAFRTMPPVANRAAITRTPRSMRGSPTAHRAFDRHAQTAGAPLRGRVMAADSLRSDPRWSTEWSAPVSPGHGRFGCSGFPINSPSRPGPFGRPAPEIGGETCDPVLPASARIGIIRRKISPEFGRRGWCSCPAPRPLTTPLPPEGAREFFIPRPHFGEEGDPSAQRTVG